MLIFHAELDPEDNREPGQENSGSDVRSVDGACAHYVPVEYDCQASIHHL